MSQIVKKGKEGGSVYLGAQHTGYSTYEVNTLCLSHRLFSD